MQFRHSPPPNEPEYLELEPMSVVIEFRNELAAINYSIDMALRRRHRLTQMHIADTMGINRAVLSKIKQGLSGFPSERLLEFVQSTGSMTLIQFYAWQLRCVLKPKEQEESDRKERKQLESEIARLNSEIDHYRGAANDYNFLVAA